jgi:hypothetical protein
MRNGATMEKICENCSNWVVINPPAIGKCILIDRVKLHNDKCEKFSQKNNDVWDVLTNIINPKGN